MVEGDGGGWAYSIVSFFHSNGWTDGVMSLLSQQDDFFFFFFVDYSTSDVCLPTLFQKQNAKAGRNLELRSY